MAPIVRGRKPRPVCIVRIIHHLPLVQIARPRKSAAMVGTLKITAQLLVDGEIAFGPGKAALLDAIAAHGSISGAARAMGLSYRRAWLMVDLMNRRFADPLILTVAGGRGGATITPAGMAALAAYRALEGELGEVKSGAGATLVKMLSR